ncbi:cold shock and DUF1294 domain-containing protein [Halomonas denitrificans]|nr:cold shock and DUF1294 domain-containing protein [Halomonas denitrificans]
MRVQGIVVQWNDARGFGFVEPHDGGERAFVHISALAFGARRPATGDLVTYSLEKDPKGRWQACDVRPIGTRRAGVEAPAAVSVSPFERLFLFIFIGVLFAASIEGALHIAIPFIVLLLSVVTFIAYGLDKSASRRGSWRTSEATLHLLALVGGWPGALMAQRLLRHKTRKAEFQAVFWTTVVLNMVLLVVLAHWF